MSNSTWSVNTVSAVQGHKARGVLPIPGTGLEMPLTLVYQYRPTNDIPKSYSKWSKTRTVQSLRRLAQSDATLTQLYSLLGKQEANKGKFQNQGSV